MKLPVQILVKIVRVYQRFISPLLGPSCRFYPTCSDYTIESLHQHGFWRGSLLSCWRILRCGPWTSGGEDPVPEKSR